MRLYEAGRSTKGWVRGEKVTRISDVNPGDVLIGVSHQFQAENLYRVVGFKTETARGLVLDPMVGCERGIFYVVYVCPDGSIYPNDSQEMCGESVTRAVWDFDLHGTHEWFKAVPSGRRGEGLIVKDPKALRERDGSSSWVKVKA